jgi:hypothetical protein
MPRNSPLPNAATIPIAVPMHGMTRWLRRPQGENGSSGSPDKKTFPLSSTHRRQAFPHEHCFSLTLGQVSLTETYEMRIVLQTETVQCVVEHATQHQVDSDLVWVSRYASAAPETPLRKNRAASELLQRDILHQRGSDAPIPLSEKACAMAQAITMTTSRARLRACGESLRRPREARGHLVPREPSLGVGDPPALTGLWVGTVAPGRLGGAGRPSVAARRDGQCPLQSPASARNPAPGKLFHPVSRACTGGLCVRKTGSCSRAWCRLWAHSRAAELR